MPNPRYTSRTDTASSSTIIIILSLIDTATNGIVANTAFLVIDPASSCRYAPTLPATTTNAST